MLRFSTLLITIVFLAACGQSNEQQGNASVSDSTSVDTTAILNDPKNNLNVQASSFEEIDSSAIIMFPLSMGERGKSSGGLVYKEIPSFSYWNIIFYNANTSSHHLLSDRKMLIGGYNLSYKNSYNNNDDISFAGKHIYYKITVDDYDLDKKLTPDDPEYLFVTDKEGNNFRQVSPSGYNLRSWQFIKAANRVIMTVTKDSDNNKKFEAKDEICSFQIDIDKDSLATEIFSSELKKKLKVMYDKDWKRIKK